MECSKRPEHTREKEHTSTTSHVHHVPSDCWDPRTMRWTTTSRSPVGAMLQGGRSAIDPSMQTHCQNTNTFRNLHMLIDLLICDFIGSKPPLDLIAGSFADRAQPRTRQKATPNRPRRRASVSGGSVSGPIAWWTACVDWAACFRRSLGHL